LVTQLGQQNGNLNLEPSCEDQKCPIFLQSHTSIPANLDSSESARMMRQLSAKMPPVR